MSETNATHGAVALAEEHNLDLATVTGTGDGGRITKPDVQAALDAAAAATDSPPATPTPEPSGETEASPEGEPEATEEAAPAASSEVEEVVEGIEELRGRIAIVGFINDGPKGYGKGKESAYLDAMIAKVRADNGIKPSTVRNSVRSHIQGGTVKVLKRED